MWLVLRFLFFVCSPSICLGPLFNSPLLAFLSLLSFPPFSRFLVGTFVDNFYAGEEPEVESDVEDTGTEQKECETPEGHVEVLGLDDVVEAFAVEADDN